MSVLTANVGVPTKDGVLTALKNLLGSGWTYDADGEVVWRSSPSAFPVGIGLITNSNSHYLVGVVKCDGAIVKPTTNYALLLPSSQSVLTVYISPNGSVGVSIRPSSETGVALPSVIIARNSSTSSTMPSDMVISSASSNTVVLSPRVHSEINRVPYINSMYGMNVCMLTQLVDPFVGAALKDVYGLLSHTGSSSTVLPPVLANGGQKYVCMYRTSLNMYLRYE